MILSNNTVLNQENIHQADIQTNIQVISCLIIMIIYGNKHHVTNIFFTFQEKTGEKKFSCPECSRNYSHKKSLYSHARKEHLDKLENFSIPSNKKQKISAENGTAKHLHVSSIKKINCCLIPVNVIQKWCFFQEIRCDECHINFSKKKSLYRHVRTKHPQLVEKFQIPEKRKKKQDKKVTIEQSNKVSCKINVWGKNIISFKIQCNSNFFFCIAGNFTSLSRRKNHF